MGCVDSHSTRKATRMAKKAAPKPAIEMHLDCDLDDHEIADRARELGTAINRWRQLDDERKQAASRYRDELAALDGDIRELAQIVATRTETRMVEVEHRPDYDARMMHVYRLDTGELVDSRPLTADEMQVELSAI